MNIKIDTKQDNFLYIHHIWKINFQWKELKLNTASKIIDYAWWRYLIHKLQQSQKNAEFIISKSFFEWILQYAKSHDISEFLLVEPTEDYVSKNFLKIQEKLSKNNIKLTFLEDTHSFFIKHAVFEKKYNTPPTMEFFYRFIRKKENILIENWEPTGFS